MKKIIYLYFCYAIFLPHMASATDLYLFFIHGDAEYKHRSCENGETRCKKKRRIDASKTVFYKAKKLSESCDNCDVVIFYIKPGKKKVKVSPLRESYSSNIFANAPALSRKDEIKLDVKTTIFFSEDGEDIIGQTTEKTNFKEVSRSGRLLLYSDGSLLNEESIVLSGTIPPFIPIISGLAWLMRQPESFSEELKFLAESTSSRGKNYKKQFAFYFGHKIPDENSPGFFKSNEDVEFSIVAFLDLAKKVSNTMNRRNRRPFDAFFFLNCATSVNTVYETYKKNVTNLLVAHPALVPLISITSWDFLSLREHLSSNNKTHESIKAFLEKSFSPEEEGERESLVPVLRSDYLLSLYDLKRIKNSVSMEKALKKGAKISKVVSEEIGDKIKKWAAGVAALDGESVSIESAIASLADTSWKDIDCRHYSKMRPILEKLKPAVLAKYSFKYGSALRRAFKSKEEKSSISEEEKVANFSGWACF